MKKIKVIILLTLTVVFVFHQNAVAQNSGHQSVISNGSGVMQGGSQRLVGTLGQPMIGVMRNASTKNSVGFWYLSTQPNTPPTLDPINVQTVDEDATEQTISLTGISPGRGSREAGQTVTLTATSSDSDIVPHPIISGTGEIRPLTYKAPADANGSVTITVTATDNGPTGGPHKNTTSQTFIITVEPVNDAPAFDVVADQTVAEGAGIQNIAITGVSSGGGSDEANQTVTLTVTSSNPNLVPNPTISASGDTWTLAFQPSDTGTGTATLTITAKDDGVLNATFERMFIITVTAKPAIAVLSPTVNQVFLAGNTEIQLSVNIANHAEGWQWKLGEAFPENGFAGGNPVPSGNTATISGLQDGQSYTVYVVLTDQNGNLLAPSVATNVTFSIKSAFGPVTEISFADAPTKMIAGGTFQFNLIGSDANELVQPFDSSEAAWETNGGIGTVDEKGKLTVTTAGKGTVKATIKANATISAETKEITVIAAPAEKVKVSVVPDSLTAGSGETAILTITVTDAFENPIIGQTLTLTRKRRQSSGNSD